MSRVCNIKRSGAPEGTRKTIPVFELVVLMVLMVLMLLPLLLLAILLLSTSSNNGSALLVEDNAICLDTVIIAVVFSAEIGPGSTRT